MESHFLLLAFMVSGLALHADAFSPSVGSRQHFTWTSCGRSPLDQTSLWSAGGNRKRRRRKQSPTDTSVSDQETASQPAPSIEDFDMDADDEEVEVDLSLIKDVAKFKFEGGKSSLASQSDATVEIVTPEGDSTAIPLPDIKEVLRKKELEEELARIEEEESETRVKIKRSDITALKKLLEQDPYADADDSFFEEEEYGTVSALLGERALPFLGIPTGPLQVGHFIGALVIVLMAFVEYPGFPLTNLPTPLRGALQGGLLTVYSINAVLAVAAIFKANERGQPAVLWIAKTFTVGGLAFDQLTQLPTLEKIAEVKARKGKRALKKKK